MRPLTIREVTFIQNNAGRMFANDIATELDRPVEFVMKTAKKYKVRVYRIKHKTKIVKTKSRVSLNIIVRGKIKSLAVHVYEWKTGHPIPKGYSIRFLDGNTLNCTPNNVDIIRVSELGVPYRLKPGNVPFNARTKGIMKPNKTSFKAGKSAINAMHDAAISIRKKDGESFYKYIRVGPSKWVRLHRYNWEKKNGAIPKGMILRAIDGDTLNCEPNNWQLITRAENVKLNQNRVKAGESIAHRYRIKKAIAKHRAEFPALFE